MDPKHLLLICISVLSLHPQRICAQVDAQIPESRRCVFICGYVRESYTHPLHPGKRKIRETSPKTVSVAGKPLDVTLYPNPAKDLFQIQTNEIPIQKLEILDLTGKKVMQREHIDGYTVRIPVDELKNGVYFVTLECGGQTVTKVLHVVH